MPQAGEPRYGGDTLLVGFDLGVQHAEPGGTEGVQRN